MEPIYKTGQYVVVETANIPFIIRIKEIFGNHRGYYVGYWEDGTGINQDDVRIATKYEVMRHKIRNLKKAFKE